MCSESAHVEFVRDVFLDWMAFVFAFISDLGSVWFVAPAVVLVLVVVELTLVWLFVGVGGGLTLIGLPRLLQYVRLDGWPLVSHGPS